MTKTKVLKITKKFEKKLQNEKKLQEKILKVIEELEEESKNLKKLVQNK